MREAFFFILKLPFYLSLLQRVFCSSSFTGLSLHSFLTGDSLGFMAKVSKESYFTSFDKTRLFYEVFDDIALDKKGTFLVVHGLGGHSGVFKEFAQILNKNGFQAIALNLRGHGLSDGQRGYVAQFSYFERDLHLFIKHIRKALKVKSPLFLLGQSMGALVCFDTIIGYGEQNLSGLILTCPALGEFKKQVPPFKELIAEWTSKYFPRITMFNELEYKELTRNKEAIEAFKKDVFFHRRISPRLFLQMRDKMRQSYELASEIKIPVFFVSSQGDPVFQHKEHKKVFENLAINKKDKKFLTFKNLKHDLFLEKKGGGLYEEVVKWAKQRV